MAEEELVSQIIWVPQEHVDEAVAIAAKNDVKIERAPIAGVAPFLLVPLVILGTAAGVAIIQREIEVWRGGQVIDLTKTPPDVHRDRGLQYGLLLLIKSDGTVSIKTPHPKDSFSEVMETVGGLLEKIAELSINKTSEVIKGALGDKAEVETSEKAPALLPN